MSERPKLSTNDPALETLNRLAVLLEPMTRLEQLKIMAAACVQLGHYDESRLFTNMAEEEQRLIDPPDAAER